MRGWDPTLRPCVVTSVDCGMIARMRLLAGVLVAIAVAACGSTKVITQTTTRTLTTTDASASLPAKVWVSPSTAVQMPAVRQPKTFGFSADGSGWAHVRTWTSWTNSEATATAVMEINQCNPSCGGGTFTAYPGLLVLSDPQPCPNGAPNEYMAVTFIPDLGDAFPSDVSTFRQTLSCTQRANSG